MRRIFLALLFCLSLPVAGHVPVDGDIYLTTSALTYATQRLSHEFDSPFLMSPGIIAEGDLDEHGGLEIAMFYLRNSFSVRKENKVVTERVKRMYLSLGYRHWFTQKVSAAGAFFSSYSMGDPEIVRDDFNDRTRPETSARDTTEYGLDFSVQFEPLHRDRFSLVLDARYAYSLTPKRGEDSNHYGLIIGIKYFVQSRERDPDEAEED